MFRVYQILFLPILLHAGLFDWFETLSPKAERAKKQLEGLDPIIEKALKDYQVPGLAIGVVVDGHVVYAKGFGYRDVEKKLPVTPDTLFAMGSCTKGFTSFLFGNLVDEGHVGWDQQVIDILPEFRLWDQYATTNLTFRDLLTHRSGLPRHEFLWYNSKISQSEMLKRIRYLQPSGDIRERYQYGNLMYFTVGLAIERITGRPWDHLVRDRILKPLEMTHSNFSIEETQKTDNYAIPYIEKNDKLKKMAYRNLSLIGPAGALNSNIRDMMHWVQMQLAGGGYKNQALISPATLQELHTPQVVIHGAPESEESLLSAYAIGWQIHLYRGHYSVSHDGVSDGFTSVIGLLPKQNIGYVILVNKNMTALPRYLSCSVMDLVLELTPSDRVQRGADGIRKNKESMKQTKVEEDRTRKKGTVPSHPLEEYIGSYEHPGYGKVSIDLVDGKLEATYNDLSFVLGHWHYDVFSVIQEKQDMIVSIEGKKFTFANDSHGDIGELMIPFEPSSDDIVFKRKSEGKLSTLNYLRQFTGAYVVYGYTVEIVVRDHSLFAIIPGQPNYELTPVGDNEFIVKEMTGSTVRFVMDSANKVAEILLIHPYGAFTANPKR